MGKERERERRKKREGERERERGRKREGGWGGWKVLKGTGSEAPPKKKHRRCSLLAAVCVADHGPECPLHGVPVPAVGPGLPAPDSPTA